MKFYKTVALQFVLFIINLGNIQAQNPISPPGVYIADPSPKVWEDGNLYVYGSTDESCEQYCSAKHDVLYTSDMINWEIADSVFASTGINDEVPYNETLLFAPDVEKKGDMYYMYYCQPYPQAPEGVATSKSPLGPFGNGQKIDLGGYNQIDPSVFIDDDGTAYYLWGQFSLKMARLKPNMKELDKISIQTDVITEEDHFFHEGAYLTKRDDIYYLVYADISREDKPTCIGYATSTSPFGPYTYGGVIVDNSGSNPGNWNNHGSIAKFKDQWYVFYHRSTHGCKTMRKAAIEKIHFLPNGSIPEVEMTSQGAGPPLDAKQEIDAASACLLHGNVRIEAISAHNEGLTQFRNGDEAIYKFLDFGKGIKSMSIRIRRLNGGKLHIFSDKPWHKRLAIVEISSGTMQNDWETLTLEVNSESGIHALWLQAHGGEGDLFEIDWLKFE